MKKFYLKKYIHLLLLFFTLLSFSCGKGISPSSAEEAAGFSGTITFKGEWPADIQRTFLVVFDSLLLEINDFNVFNLKYVSGEIPFGVQIYNYSSLDSSFVAISPGQYEYAAVIQSRNPEVTFNREDYFVAGIYYVNGDTTKPGSLLIPENTLVRSIDIVCDFDNPPPQPPGGN